VRKILVEYLRLEKEGNTCSRCASSEDVVKRVVREFSEENPGVEIELKEIPLDEKRIGESNTLRINGKDIKEILKTGEEIKTLCVLCCDMIGDTVLCNSFVYKGKVVDSLPEEILREALRLVIDKA